MARLPRRRGLTRGEEILARIASATEWYDDSIQSRDWWNCDLASAELSAALEEAKEWHEGRCAGRR